MKINLRAQRYKQHEILVFQYNLPNFPLEKISQEDFPISYKLKDIHGEEISVTIDKDYKLKVDGKNKSYPLHKLYEWVYGIDKKAGKEKAFEYEASAYGPLTIAPDLLPADTSTLPAEHQPFSFDYTYDSIRAEWKPFLNVVRYHRLSPTGHSIAYKDYHPQKDRIRWDVQGVFRIHPTIFDSSTSHIVVTDTPIIEDYLNHHEIPALTLPSEQELSYYDYGKILAGKTVYFCTSLYGLNYSFSIYPFATTLLSQGIKLHIVDCKKAFGQQSLPDWHHNHKKSSFWDILEKHSRPVYPSDVPSRNYYDKLVEESSSKQFHPAQDFTNNSLNYSLKNGDIVFSKPLRVIRKEEIELYEGIVPHANTADPQSELSQFRLEKIQQHDYFAPSETYSKLRSFLKRYIYFKQESYFDLLTSWILLTYVFRVFRAFPYVHLSGVRGTGKSTVLEIVSKLSFNGFFQTRATISTSVEMAHSHASTLCIDEFEDYSGRRNSHDELSKFLNSGYNYTGSFTKRVGKNSTTFFTYSPKIFGGTGEIGLDTLKSRTIPIKTFKKPDNVSKEQFLEFDYQTIAEINSLKTSLFALGLHHASSMYSLSLQDYSDKVLPISKQKLNNRQLELARPLLTLATFLESQQVMDSLLTGLDKCWNKEQAFESSLEKELFKILENYVNQTDSLTPKYDKEGLTLYNAKELFNNSTIQSFAKKNEVGKMQFNTLISASFNIQRDDIYIPSEKKPKSCYLVPDGLFN